MSPFSHLFRQGLSQQILQDLDWQEHLESLPLPMWIGDASGGNIYVNQAYCDLLGVSRWKLVSGFSWSDHVHPGDREGYVAAWNDFVAGKTRRFKELMRWIRPDDGREIRLAVRAQRIGRGLEQFQGWLRPALTEEILEDLEALADGGR